jgi:NAD(P)-dependent dehydrogenase (short-subunit alcohol dehydrogenase family)
MTDAKLQGKRVVVIGGSSGIGFAVARGAASAGAQVVIGSRDQRKVDAACSRLGGTSMGCPVDVRDESSVTAFFDEVGPFDHLVFTAGDWGSFRAPRPTAEIDLESAGDVFAVRFWGAMRAIKHAVQRIAADGSITVTNGVVAHRPRKGAPLSTAMAGAIEHLTQGLAVDLAPLRVNVVCPGLVLTEVWDSIPEDERADRLRRMTADQPLPRAGDPDEVAEAYLYLMCGTFSTGQVLVVDGGRTLV